MWQEHIGYTGDTSFGFESLSCGYGSSTCVWYGVTFFDVAVVGGFWRDVRNGIEFGCFFFSGSGWPVTPFNKVLLYL